MSTTMRKAREIEIKPVPAGLLCTRCKKSLPAGEFSPDPRAKRRGGKRYYCKPCEVEARALRQAGRRRNRKAPVIIAGGLPLGRPVAARAVVITGPSVRVSVAGLDFLSPEGEETMSRQKKTTVDMDDLAEQVKALRRTRHLTAGEIADRLLPDDLYGINKVQQIIDALPRCLRFRSGSEVRGPVTDSFLGLVS
jgi:hypothetical protein